MPSFLPSDLRASPHRFGSAMPKRLPNASAASPRRKDRPNRSQRRGRGPAGRAPIDRAQCGRATYSLTQASPAWMERAVLTS